MLLSIGMIVKNEQKYLRQCLEGLKQILDNIDSELIIVDTGSTDDTVAIAKEFTDKVLHFEWCNDFAAARNVSLENSKGEWFMFIDADEIIEDALEIIGFFNSGEYKKYGVATYIVRNYNNEKKEDFADFHAVRMAQRNSELCFRGIIHEHLKYATGNKKSLSTIAHHYGYVGVSKSSTKKKAMRNIEGLLKELEGGGRPLRTYMHLAQAYSSVFEFDKAEECMLKAINVIDSGEFKDYDRNIDFAVYLLAVSQYKQRDKNEEAIRVIEKYIASKNNNTVLDVDLYALKVFVCKGLRRYSETIEAYNQYKLLYNLYNNGELCLDGATYYMLEYTTEKNYRKTTYQTIAAYMELEKYQQAKELLSEIDISIFDGTEFDLNQYIHIAVTLMEKLDDYTGIQALINHTNSKVRKTVEKYITVNYEHYPELMEYLSDTELVDEKYAQLVKIRVMSDDGEDVKQLISSFCEGLVYNEIYSDALYYILKNLLPIQEILNIEGYYMMLQDMQMQIVKENEILDVVYEYIASLEELNGFVEIAFVFYLYNILLNSVDNFHDSKAKTIVEEYTEIAEAYLIMANPDKLNDECITAYMPDVQFAYYIKKGAEQCAKGEFSEAVKTLKKALRADNRKKDVVNLLLEDIKEKMSGTEKNPDNEFQEYAQKVKAAIVNLINNRDAVNARKFFEAYKKINADDVDIEHLKRRLELLENNI